MTYRRMARLTWRANKMWGLVLALFPITFAGVNIWLHLPMRYFLTIVWTPIGIQLFSLIALRRVFRKGCVLLSLEDYFMKKARDAGEYELR